MAAYRHRQRRPVANFLFAIAALLVLFASGTTGLAPVVGAVEEGSPAYQAGFYAGDEIPGCR